VAGTTVSPRSGSGVAALLTVVAEATVVASGSIRWTPVRAAIALARSPAPACSDAAPLGAPWSPVGVEAPKAVPHRITPAMIRRDLITDVAPP